MTRSVSGDVILQKKGGTWEEVMPNDRVPDLLRGKRIVHVLWEHDDDGNGNGLFLELDDGVCLFIDGWGHDWWGTSVSEWVGGLEKGLL